MTIFVGTSGYSYQDWKGPFYAADIKDGDMLAYYARYFPTVEINFTYYRMPNARTIASILRKGPDLIYAVKLPGEITHEGKLGSGGAAEFLKGVAPMRDAGALGCVLAQFPWRFKYSDENLGYLTDIAEALKEVAVVAEVRNDTWANRDAWDKLREIGVGFCNVDEPPLRGLMPATGELTSDIGYFRFHGRNTTTWFRHGDAADRYNYLYKEEELAEWVPRIKKVAKKAAKTFVFMNNHPLGQAVTNAQMLMDLLDIRFDRSGDAALF